MLQFIELSRLIAFSLFTAYLLAIVSKHGVLPSISESDYKLKKPFGYAFEIMIFIAGISIFLSGLRFDNPIVVYLFTIGGALIFGVGVFPRFKRNKTQQIIHSLCAFFGFFITLLAISFITWYAGALILLFAFISEKMTKVKSRRTWNVEVVISYSIFFALELIHIFKL